MSKVAHVAIAVTGSVFLASAAGCAGMRGGAAPLGEAPASASASVGFLEADVDGDARVTPSELKRWTDTNRIGVNRFDAADGNLDGMLTFDEWQAVMGGSRAAAGGSARMR